MSADLLTFMKIAALLCAAVAAVMFLTGCTSGIAAKLNKLPDGRFASAKLEQTDKFTSTTIDLTGVTKDNGTFIAERMVIDHTNPWVTKFRYEVTGYYGQLSAAEKRKLIPSAAPAPSESIPPGAFVPRSALPPKRNEAAPADPAPVAPSVDSGATGTATK
jgi:hypothetical protein